MARAVGANFRLAAKQQADETTTATGNFDRFSCFTFELAASQPLQTDNLLSAGASRDQGAPFLDTLTVEGSCRVPLDLAIFGRWLAGMFGDPTTTGSAPNYIHVFRSGATALSSWSIEAQYPDVPSFSMFSGVRVDGFEIDLSPSGSADATVRLLGRNEVRAGTTAAGTLVTTPIVRFQRQQGGISRNGVALANVTGGTCRFSNSLEAVRTIRSDLALEGVDLGIATAGGQLTVRFADATLIDQAIANTAAELAYSYTIDANRSLTFRFPEVYLSRPGIAVTGPTGIELTVDWQAAFNVTATCMLEVTLRNQTASYAAWG